MKELAFNFFFICASVELALITLPWSASYMLLPDCLCWSVCPDLLQQVQHLQCQRSIEKYCYWLVLALWSLEATQSCINADCFTYLFLPGHIHHLIHFFLQKHFCSLFLWFFFQTAILSISGGKSSSLVLVLHLFEQDLLAAPPFFSCHLISCLHFPL